MNREGRPLRTEWRIFRNPRKRDLDCFFKLWIASGNHICRCDLDIEIRCNADIFDSPSRSAGIVRRAIRQLNAAAIDEIRREVIRTDASPKSAFADDWTNLRKLEHKRTGLGSRTVQFVYDHHLHRWRRIHWRRDIVAAAKHVIVKRLALHPFDQIVGRDPSAVETLVNDDALLVSVSSQSADRVHDAIAAVAFDKDIA